MGSLALLVLSNSRKTIFLKISNNLHEFAKVLKLLVMFRSFTSCSVRVSSLLILHEIETVMANDAFSQYTIEVPRSLNRVDLSMEYPAAEWAGDINSLKEKQKLHFIEETPELYEQVTLPWIKKIPPSKNQWIANILAGKSELDRKLFEVRDEVVVKGASGESTIKNNGFVLLVDLKWDTRTMSELYCCVLSHDPSIYTMRELDGSRLSMLCKIRDECSRVIHEKYGIYKDRLVMFVHYSPSYYHFHVHIVSVETKTSQTLSDLRRCHLLDDIIANIRKDSNYYRQKSLAFYGTSHPLIQHDKAQSQSKGRSPHSPSRQCSERCFVCEKLQREENAQTQEREVLATQQAVKQSQSDSKQEEKGK